MELYLSDENKYWLYSKHNVLGSNIAIDNYYIDITSIYDYGYIPYKGLRKAVSLNKINLYSLMCSWRPNENSNIYIIQKLIENTFDRHLLYKGYPIWLGIRYWNFNAKITLDSSLYIVILKEHIEKVLEEHNKELLCLI